MAGKEGGMLRRLIKCYEDKQYKSGLRLSKQLLSSAGSGQLEVQCLAYRALCLTGLGRTQEALELVRTAIR